MTNNDSVDILVLATRYCFMFIKCNQFAFWKLSIQFIYSGNFCTNLCL